MNQDANRQSSFFSSGGSSTVGVKQISSANFEYTQGTSQLSLLVKKKNNEKLAPQLFSNLGLGGIKSLTPNSTQNLLSAPERVSHKDLLFLNRKYLFSRPC